jgi:hypothetical protein
VDLLAGVGSAQHGADPGQELPRTEGLGEIVVRAQLQAHDAVGFLGAAGQDDDRQLRFSTQLAQQLHAVLALQPQIEQHQIQDLVTKRTHQLRTSRRLRHPKIVLLQVLADELAHRDVVVDHQHMRNRRLLHHRGHP